MGWWCGYYGEVTVTFVVDLVVVDFEEEGVGALIMVVFFLRLSMVAQGGGSGMECCEIEREEKLVFAYGCGGGVEEKTSERIGEKRWSMCENSVLIG